MRLSHKMIDGGLEGAKLRTQKTRAGRAGRAETVNGIERRLGHLVEPERGLHGSSRACGRRANCHSI